MDSLTFEALLERDGSLAYTNKGVSMMPLLRQNRDVMVIRAKGQTPLRKLDAVLFRRPGPKGETVYVLHRILRVNGDGTYWILGDNCVTGDTVPEAEILGVLTAVQRDGRALPVTNWNYRLYVNTWCRCYRLRIAFQRAARSVRGGLGRLRRKLRPRRPQ